MKIAVLAALVTGCAGSYQSARPLGRGKVQVTADVNAMRWTAAPAMRPPETRDWMNGGDLLVRAAIVDRVDAGIRLGRTFESESKGDQYSHLLFDAKRQLTARDSLLAVSIAPSVGVLWSERRDNSRDFTLAVAPTLFVGYDIAPTRELVAGVSVMWLDPFGDERYSRPATDSYLAGRVMVGLRVSPIARTWAVQPELSMLKAEDNDGFMLSVGLGVAAGN